MNRRHALSTVAALLASAAWAVSAAAETRVAQEVEVGYQTVDQNNPEAKFYEYRDVPEGVVLESYSMDVDADNYDLSFGANKLTQEDQSAELSYNRRGKLWFNADYDQTPHRWSETSRTLYNEANPGNLLLPDSMQSYFQTNPGTVTWWNTMPSTLEGSHTQKLAVRADKASFNLGGALSKALSMDLNFSQQKKTGHQMMPVALGRSYAIELARPVDETTYDSSVALNYASKGTQLGFSYGLNLYENDIQTLIWDNGKRLTDRFTAASTWGDDSAQGRASISPDNMAHNARLSAGVDLPVQSRFNADVTYTRMMQDEELLPYTINTAMNSSTNTVGFNAFDAATLPTDKAGADQTLWVQDYHLSNNRIKRLTLGVKARSEQLGNDSKEITFTGHTTLDQSWSGTDEETARFTYRKLNLGGYADLNLLSSLALGVDFNQETAERTHREYKETVESTWMGRVNFTPQQWLTLRGRYINANRDAKDFEIEDYMSSTSTFAENPGIRRYDIASRVRNAGDVQIQAWKGPLTLTLNGGLGHDKYKPGDGELYNPLAAVSTTNQNKQYGLLENRLANAAVDLGVDISDGVGVAVFYQLGLVSGVQRQNQNTTPNNSPVVNQDAAYDYTLNTEERYDTLGLALDTIPTPRTGLHFGYDIHFSRGAMDYSNLGSSLSSKVSVPETKTEKQDFTVKGELRATKDVSLSLGYLFEIYNINDFATENVPLAAGQAIPQTNIMLGDSSLDYKAHVVTVMAKYKW